MPNTADFAALERLVRKECPALFSLCQDTSVPNLVMHHSAFQIFEMRLLGAVAKYACLRGKTVTIVGED